MNHIIWVIWNTHFAREMVFQNWGEIGVKLRSFLNRFKVNVLYCPTWPFNAGMPWVGLFSLGPSKYLQSCNLQFCNDENNMYRWKLLVTSFRCWWRIRWFWLLGSFLLQAFSLVAQKFWAKTLHQHSKIVPNITVADDFIILTPGYLLYIYLGSITLDHDPWFLKFNFLRIFYLTIT